MKSNIIKVLTVGVILSVFSVGCALTQKLPSVTVGGAANKDAILGAKASKKSLSLTAPLLNVDIPLPSAEKVKD